MKLLVALFTALCATASYSGDQLFRCSNDFSVDPARAKRENCSLIEGKKNPETKVPQEDEEEYFSKLYRLIPNLKEVNKDPGFLAWLAEIDPATGRQRQAQLTAAQNELNVYRTYAIFQEYLRSHSEQNSYVASTTENTVESPSYQNNPQPNSKSFDWNSLYHTTPYKPKPDENQPKSSEVQNQALLALLNGAMAGIAFAAVMVVWRARQRIIHWVTKLIPTRRPTSADSEPGKFKKHWLPIILAVVSVRLFGILGAATIAVIYIWLQPRKGVLVATVASIAGGLIVTTAATTLFMTNFKSEPASRKENATAPQQNKIQTSPSM